jgi:hypothetical protein
MRDPRPTIQETEAYLRKSIPIPDTDEVNLWSLADPSNTKTTEKPPKVSDMIRLAIWGSQNHKLTLHQIYDEFENRYPSLKEYKISLGGCVMRRSSKFAQFV